MATGKTRRKPTSSKPQQRKPVKRNQNSNRTRRRQTTPSKNTSAPKPKNDKFKPSTELKSDKNSNSRGGELSSNLMKGFDMNVSEPKSAPPNERAPKENFQYNGQAPGDYRGAQASTDPKAGTKANQKINQEYESLSQAYKDYLGGDVASFPSMAKNGSHLAGQQIQNLENAQLAMKGDPKAMTDAMRGMANQDNIVQGSALGKGIAERAAGDEKASDVLTNPLGTAGKVAGEMVGDGLNTMDTMKNSLIAGNTEIHHSAAPAAHAFLKGEANGGKGMEELKKAGYFPGSEKDPHGLYTKAYSMLPKVRELGMQAANESDPAKRKQLEKQRDDLMKRSNMHLFTQEQLTLEQPKIYQNKTMKNAIKSIGGTMNVRGPKGKYDLLPKGGDWTDFKTRMGYQQVDKAGNDTVTINGKDGKPVHFRADPNAVGTISHYSNQNTTGDNARKIVDTPVQKLGLPVTTSTGAGVDGIGSGLSNGNAGQVAGSVTTIPARIASDVSQQSGQALQRNGNEVFNSGAEYYQRHLENKPGLSDDVDRAIGFGNMVVGDVRQRVGNGIEKTGQVLGTAAEAVDKGIETGVNTTVRVAKAANRKAYRARMVVQRKLASLWPF